METIIKGKRVGCPGAAQGHRLWAVYDAARSVLELPPSAPVDDPARTRAFARLQRAVFARLRRAVKRVEASARAMDTRRVAPKRRAPRKKRYLEDAWKPGGVFGPRLTRRRSKA